MKHKFTLFAALSAFCGICGAENLIYNSGFELGEAGWDKHYYSRLRNDNPECKPEKSVSFPEGDSAGGKRALRIEPGPDNVEILVSSYNFPVKKNTVYTFSYYVKQVKPGRISFIVDAYSAQRELRYDAAGNVLPDTGFANAAKENFLNSPRSKKPVTTEWTRHSVTFNTGKNSAYGIRIYMGGGSTGAVLLDNFQVEEGVKLSVYTPKAPLELSVKTDDYLYENPESVSGKVAAISYSGDLKKEITLTFRDDFFERDLMKQNLTLNLKKGTVAEVPFTFKGKIPYGSYQIFTSLQPRTTDPDFVRDWKRQPEVLGFNRLQLGDESYLSRAKFVAVPTPAPKTADGFRLGSTGSVSPGGDRYSDSKFGETSEETVRMIRLAGGNIYRRWDGMFARWAQIEPQKGKFDWRRCDFEMDAAEKTGMDTLCVIGGMFTDKRGAGIFFPEWVRNRDRSGNPKGTPCPKDTMLGSPRFKANYFRPQLADWRNYVSAIAKRYKGRIKYYELTNEPNLCLPAAEYMEYMKAASEEIRKADPDAVILGLCSTSDFGANLDDFIGRCLKLDADKYMDHITIHPYAKLDNSAPQTQMDARRRLLANLKRGGYKAGLWNGENYYVIPDWMPATDFAARVLPEDIARHLIIDMGEGCSGSTATHLDTLTGKFGKPFMVERSRVSTMRHPDARFAAHAAAAHFIAGAKPVATHEPGLGTLGYTFRKGGTLYTAVWNSRAPVPTALNVPPFPCRLYDMMSNPAEFRERIPLTAKPWYIEWGKEVKAADVIRWIDTKALYKDSSFIVDSRVLLARSGDAKRLVFSIQNQTGKMLDRKMVSVSSPAFKSPAGQLCRNWKDLNTFMFSVPVGTKENGGFDVTFTAEDFPKFKMTRPALPAEMLVLGPAAHTSAVEKHFYGKPSSPEDFSASLTLSCRRGALHATLEVKDDKPGKPAASTWDTDSIELFIDRAPFSGDPVKYGEKTRQLTFVRNEKKQVLDGISCEITERTDGYTAEFRIPVRYEDFLGLDFAVNDSDGEHRKSQLVWSGSGDNYKDRSGFKLIRITPAFTSRMDIREKKSDGKYLRYGVNDVAGTDWTPQTFTVVPERDGKLPLLILSGYSTGEQYTAEYRRLKVTGGTLRNADFSQKRADGTPKQWSFSKLSGIRTEDGETVIYSVHNFPCSGVIDVKAGVPVTVKYESRVKTK